MAVLVLVLLFFGMAAGALIAVAGIYEAIASATSPCAAARRLLAGLGGILLFAATAAGFAPAILA